VNYGESAAEIARLHDAILHYLQSNPNAADTLDGIMNWWLSEQGYEQVSAESVYQALERLIAERVVKKVSLINGAVLYKRNDLRS
jgi:Fe2+ or Zn2+ uptake regulation protein